MLSLSLVIIILPTGLPIITLGTLLSALRQTQKSKVKAKNLASLQKLGSATYFIFDVSSGSQANQPGEPYNEEGQ